LSAVAMASAGGVTAGAALAAAMNFNIYEALLPAKGLRLKINIVETLFLDQFGDPAAWYRTDPKTGSVRVERRGLGWERAVGLVRAAAAKRGGGGAAAAGGTVAVERSRAVALLLHDDDLGALAQRVGARASPLLYPRRSVSPRLRICTHMHAVCNHLRSLEPKCVRVLALVCAGCGCCWAGRAAV
jgi:hypothetical protein